MDPAASPPPPPAPLPPQNSSFMSPLKRQGVEFFGRLHSRVVILCVVVVLLLFAATVSAVAAVVYGNAPIPFLKDKRHELMVVFYRIPLIPKTPEMILVAAVESNSHVETYHPAFSLSADFGIGAIDSASADISLEGPFDLTTENGISFDLQGSIAVNAEPLIQDELSGKIRKIGKDTYFKIDTMPMLLMGFLGGYYADPGGQTEEIPEEIQNNLSETYSYWIKQEPNQLDTEARKALNENSSESSLIEGFKNNVNDFLLIDAVLPEITLEADEDIEGTSTYHLSLAPTNQMLQTIIDNYYESERGKESTAPRETINALINGIDNLVIDIWVGKGDAIVRKAALRGSLALSDSSFLPIGAIDPYGTSFTGEANPLRLSVSTAVVIKDINKEVVITPPEKAITMQEYGVKLQDSLLTADARDAQEKKTQYDSDLTEISNALLRYYVVNNSYPASLNELITNGELQSTYASRLSTYSYRTNLSRQEYIVFTEFSDPTSYRVSQFYGTSSSYSYPRALTANDFVLN